MTTKIMPIFVAVVLGLSACNPFEPEATSDTSSTETSEPSKLEQAVEETVSETQTVQTAADKSSCPVISSDNWKASISSPSEGGAARVLTVTGELTLPTPGYTFAWDLGPADRSAIPSQRITLQTRAPDGMVAQVLETRTVTFAGPALAAQYRNVTIACGDTVLATIENVGAE